MIQGGTNLSEILLYKPINLLDTLQRMKTLMFKYL